MRQITLDFENLLSRAKYLKMKVCENPIILDHIAPKIKELIKKISKKIGVCKNIKDGIDGIGRVIIGIKLISSTQTNNKDIKTLVTDLKT
jgi:hypothetical protein